MAHKIKSQEGFEGGWVVLFKSAMQDSAETKIKLHACALHAIAGVLYRSVMQVGELSQHCAKRNVWFETDCRVCLAGSHQGTA